MTPRMQRLENVNVTAAHHQGQDYGDDIDVMHVCFVLRIFGVRGVHDVQDLIHGQYG